MKSKSLQLLVALVFGLLLCGFIIVIPSFAEDLGTIESSSETYSVTDEYSETNYSRSDADIQSVAQDSQNQENIFMDPANNQDSEPQNDQLSDDITSESIEMTEIQLSQNYAELSIGDYLQLFASKYPANTTNSDFIAWSSSNPAVATINSEGTVQAISSGYTTISATCNGLQVECKVLVISETEPISGEEYFIENAGNNNYVVDITNGSKSSGANIQLYSINGTDAQKFIFNRQTDGTYVIINKGSGLAIDVKYAGTADGTNIHQYTPNGTSAQAWKLLVNDDGTFTFININSRKALDINTNKLANGTNIHLYTSNQTFAQKFRLLPAALLPVKNDTYYIENIADPNYAVTVFDHSSVNNANIELNLLEASPSQQYSFICQGDGTYIITNAQSKLALDVENASTENGANIWQHTPNGTIAQKWRIFVNEDNSFTFMNPGSKKVIMINGVELQPNANIYQYSPNGSDMQKFKLQIASALPIQNGTYTIYYAANRNFGLDISSASKNNYANLQLYSINGTVAQDFVFTCNIDGTYLITNANSGMAIDVASASTANGANIWQYEVNGTVAQQWIVQRNSDGSYTFINPNSDKVLDINSNKVADGTNIQLYQSNGTAAQKFIIKKYTGAKIIDGIWYMVKDGVILYRSTNSSLVSVTILSPNCDSPRNNTINKITIHHMAGTKYFGATECGNLFKNPSREASSNYGIGSDGKIGLYVEEHNRSWCSGSSVNDNQAITIEVADDNTVLGNNDGTGWHTSEAALYALVDLCTDICIRNQIPYLTYTGGADGTLNKHKDVSSTGTSCPGTYLTSKLPWVASEVNKRLAAYRS